MHTETRTRSASRRKPESRHNAEHDKVSISRQPSLGPVRSTWRWAKASSPNEILGNEACSVVLRLENRELNMFYFQVFVASSCIHRQKKHSTPFDPSCNLFASGFLHKFLFRSRY